VHVADRTRWGLVAGFVLVLAFVVRLGVVLQSRGGPSGVFGYDAGVYYAAADALTHGRLPYRDFVLLHPPGLMLALTPFAVLGRLTTDHTGFVVGNTAFALLGSVNAALVVRVARRMGLPIVAAAIGGLFYAVWFGAVHAEISTRLEPLGSFAFLCGLLLLLGRPEPRRRALVLAGAAFGVAACVKIWWIVPLIVVLVWQLRSAVPRRQVMPLAIGALASIAVIDGPFFAAAPGTMWRMVVLDQLRRNASHGSPVGRLDGLSTVQFAFPNLSPTAEAVALLATVLLAGALVVAAWRFANGRLLVLVAMAQVIVLFTAPSYFPFYSGYLAAPLSLVVAAAAHGARRPRPAHRFASAAAGGSVALAATLTAVAIFARPDVLSDPFPGTALAEGVENVRCVMTDSPIALIELDALSSDLAHNCPNWVDVTGRTYDVDATASGSVVARAHNAKYQADLLRYLFSGQAAIVIRAGTGLSPATRRTLDRLPVLESAGGVRVFRVPPGDPTP
jgi:alpha-1,2-mannosyltransferase